MTHGDSGVDSSMYKLKTTIVVLVHLGDNAHVANALIHSAAVEENQVTWFKFRT